MAAKVQTDNNRTWAISLSAAVAALFVLYHWILPASPASVQSFVRGWFGVDSMNQMLIYVIMSLGLNIVVGYAGLQIGRAHV